MQPIKPCDVAEAVGVQESAVPRATAGKYLHTPRGVFEFRFFVSSPVPRAPTAVAGMTPLSTRCGPAGRCARS